MQTYLGLSHTHNYIHECGQIGELHVPQCGVMGSTWCRSSYYYSTEQRGKPAATTRGGGGMWEARG